MCVLCVLDRIGMLNTAEHLINLIKIRHIIMRI